MLNKPLAYRKYLFSCLPAAWGWAQLVIHAVGCPSAVLGSRLFPMYSFQSQTKGSTAIQGILFPRWITGTQGCRLHHASLCLQHAYCIPLSKVREHLWGRHLCPATHTVGREEREGVLENVSNHHGREKQMDRGSTEHYGEQRQRT